MWFKPLNLHPICSSSIGLDRMCGLSRLSYATLRPLELQYIPRGVARPTQEFETVN